MASMAANVAIAWLILRLVGGLILAAHGAQKLFGWFGGPGMAKWEQGLQAQGFKPARFWAYLNILGELGGGLSLIFGFLTPLGAAGGFGAMFMAMSKAHWKNGFFNSQRGIEFTLAVMAIATAVGLAGPGTISLDQLFGIDLPYTLLFIILALVAVLVDIVGLAMTRPRPASSARTPSSASS
ncbi:MAG TPA: DoxX family protein [Ktedonobacterales bacterium]|nr:DoxX family protein [Ktedonobacterales bacterium]